jgi:hypothetical protein
MRHLGARGVATALAGAWLLVAAPVRAEGKPEPAQQKGPSTFEQALEVAEPAGNLTDRFDPLFAECKRDDDLEARQCATVRDATLAKLQTGIYVALGDESSLTWTPWTAQEKQLGLELHGCLACGKPLQLGEPAKPRFVTTRVPKAIKAGKAVGLDVGFYNVSLPDQGAAARFAKQTMPHLATQFVFRIGPVWKSGGGDNAWQGVTFVPLGQRVFDRCTGKVYASEPPSTKPAEAVGGGDCPAKAPVVEEALPEQLAREQVSATMRTVEGKVHFCYLTHKQEGTISVRLVLDGASGIEGLQVGAPFDGTPSGECVKKALKEATFGHFTGEKMTIIYPFMLR